MTDRPPYRVAVIVTVYNEALLLPIWLTYYGRAFGLSNLFVLDDGSTDGSTDNLGDVNVIKLDEPTIDQKRRAVNVAYFHRHLLRHYQAAIYVDVDEFLVVDPLLKVDIRTYIEQTSVDHFNALGLNVVHDTFSEPEYTPHEPLFAQRHFVRFERLYSKQLIHKKPVIWSVGFHVTNQPMALARGLYLFHTRAFDLQISRVRINARNKLAWSNEAIALNHGWQNRLAEQEYLKMYYIFDRGRFERAELATRFNELITRMAVVTQTKPITEPGAGFAELEAPVLTLPERFRAAIPAVQSVDEIAVLNRSEGLEGIAGLDVAALHANAMVQADEERGSISFGS